MELQVSMYISGSGVRGFYNKDLTVEDAARVGRFIGSLNKNFIIGMDPRIGSLSIKLALTSGLISSGADVIDTGIVPTPLLSRLSRSEGVWSISVTASHNPPEFVGFKIMNELGEDVSDLIKNMQDTSAGLVSGRYQKTNLQSYYLNDLLKLFSFDTNIKIAVDSGNGANCFLAPTMLKQAGINTIEINSSPTHPPARPYEPVDKNITELKQLVANTDIDLGVAYDGDGDRSIFVTSDGQFLDGSRTLAIIAKYKKTRLLVTNIGTSSVVDTSARRVIRTKVGERFIIKEIKQSGADLAGEENGGIIYPDWSMMRDGPRTTLELLDIMQKTGKSLTELDAEFPAYHQIKQKFTVSDRDKAVDAARKQLGAEYETDLLDGVKAFIDDGWVLVRASTTEPIVKIFAEAPKEKAAKLCFSKGINTIRGLIIE
ncbi:MAG: hypothetical protein GOU99_00535 [Candidatus Altiarchaeota archaeon]|nr:hypothetical protein [Candidatus Altiarchaeota archaeon]